MVLALNCGESELLLYDVHRHLKPYDTLFGTHTLGQDVNLREIRVLSVYSGEVCAWNEFVLLE